ncbi:flavin reductase family protein [Rhizobium sp. BR 314]|uniref:flavin reductase family protein n=1 Tax=Rhizobium sp. BR 314 TaxID=3040013 RepID=UPI0039BF381C
MGFTCQSFHSLLLEPSLVSFSVMHSSASWPKIRAAGIFSVNILASGQREISNALGDKWQGVAWSGTTSGNPVIEGSLAWVDCTLYEEHLAGDDRIVIGLMNDMSVAQSENEQQPLIFFKGRHVEPA